MRWNVPRRLTLKITLNLKCKPLKNAYETSGGCATSICFFSQRRRVLLSKEQAMEFYAEHHDKPFFSNLINFMTSGKRIDRCSGMHANCPSLCLDI